MGVYWVVRPTLEEILLRLHPSASESPLGGSLKIHLTQRSYYGIIYAE